MGERVLWMAGNGVQQARLNLTPPHLGPVEIQIRVKNEQASVNFIAQHPFTRDALEASIPRLREMLGESNLNLADVHVGSGNTNGGGTDKGEQQAGSAGASWSNRTIATEETPKPTRTRLGLVDDFA